MLRFILLGVLVAGTLATPQPRVGKQNALNSIEHAATDRDFDSYGAPLADPISTGGSGWAPANTGADDSVYTTHTTGGNHYTTGGSDYTTGGTYLPPNYGTPTVSSGDGGWTTVPYTSGPGVGVGVGGKVGLFGGGFNLIRTGIYAIVLVLGLTTIAQLIRTVFDAKFDLIDDITDGARNIDPETISMVMNGIQDFAKKFE